MQKHRISTLAIAILLLTVVSTGCSRSTIADTGSTGQSDIGQPIEKALDQIVQTYTAEGQFSGSVLVAQSGRILLSKGYGTADYETNAENKAETQYLIASMSKQFTAFAILKLRDEHKLDLDDPAKKYLPQLQKWGELTIRQLLEHVSGLPRSTHTRYNGQGRYTIEETDLLFAPGSQFSYSNTGYFLLACIVEKVSGKSYGAYLQENVFGPLRMTRTGSSSLSPCKELAKGLINRKILQDGTLFSVTSLSELPSNYTAHGGLVQLEATGLADNLGAGDIYSTVKDMYTWSQALQGGKLLSQTSLDEMFTPGEGNYGYGWYIWPGGEWMNTGHKTIEHSGLIEGFTSRICIFPDDDAVIIVLSNIENAPEEQLNHALSQALFDQTSVTAASGQPPVSAEKIWRDHLQAAGGEKAMEAQKAQVRKGYWKTRTGTTIPVTVQCKAPDKWALTFTIPGGTVKQYFDGTRYRIETPAGIEPMSAAQGEEWKDVFRLAPPMHLPKALGDMTVVCEATLGGQPCYVLEDKTKENRVFLSKESMMPVRIDRTVKTPLVQYIRTYFDQYKEVDGVMLPFTTRRTGWEIDFYQIEHADTMDDSVFRD